MRQAGSYVGPDKLRFDFSHGASVAREELRDVEDRVNEWISRNDPVRPITTTLDEAKRLGAMALFGEKYGDVVRMVEIGEGEYSRELCGGTHVRSYGGDRRRSGSSARPPARRTCGASRPSRGPAGGGAAARPRPPAGRDGRGAALARPRTRPRRCARELKSRKELERAARKEPAAGGADIEQLLAGAEDLDGARVLLASAQAPDPKACSRCSTASRVASGTAVIVLAAPGEGRVHLVASVAPGLVERGVKAGQLVKVAAAEVGGGGGGRDTMAQAGGRDPEKLEEAMSSARRAIVEALGS